MAQYSGNEPVNVPIRPLNSGMILNQPEQLMPKGSFVNLENIIVKELGIQKRPGYKTFCENLLYGSPAPGTPILGTTKGDEIIQDVVIARTSSGGGDTLVFTNYYVYRILTDTTLGKKALEKMPSNASGIETTRDIVTGIEGQYCVFTSKELPIEYYDNSGSTAEWITDNPAGVTAFKAATLSYYKGRLFVANTLEDSEQYRYRIRWSKVGNLRDFSEPTAFLDLPASDGEILNMDLLGDNLVVYFTDAIYIGIPSNIPGLPVTFKKIETAKDGLIGKKAFTSWNNGHFFIGQDDIYFLNQNGLQEIGTPILDKTVFKSVAPEKSYVAIDPFNERIVFTFPDVKNGTAYNIWSYAYKRNAWSYESHETTFLANPYIDTTTSWTDATGSWESTLPTTTWKDTSTRNNFKSLLVSNNLNVSYLSQAGTVDFQEIPIPVNIETPDFDFDLPNTNKTLTRLSLKVDYNGEITTPIIFNCYISNNRGRKYYPAGQLVIRPGDDEGYITPKFTSSHFRIKLSSSTFSTNYVITELVLRLVTRGNENTMGNQG